LKNIRRAANETEMGGHMLTKLLGLALCTVLAMPALAQNRGTPESTAAATKTAMPADASILAGKWTYRSYVNTAALVDDDKDKALAIIFGEGVYAFDPLSGTALTGTLDMGGGYVLDLKGTVTQTALLSVAISGYGRAGTPTAGWEYDYNASLAYQWPNGVNQTPALVGSVIRAKRHNGGAAGVVASFIAVKQP
jgi:hypothetical protein